MGHIKWYEIYSRFAEHLNNFYGIYKNDSGKKLYQACRSLDPDFQIIPWIKNFSKYNVTSIDPIHIYASFNYWKVSLDIRKKRMLFFCNVLRNFELKTGDIIEDLQEADLDIFQYFPHPNITYIVGARSNDVQKEVWKFFSLICKQNYTEKYEKDEIAFIFDDIDQNWFGVRRELATIFMFWVNSSRFLPLDKNTLALLKQYNKLKSLPSTYDDYIKLLTVSSTNLYRNLAKVAINEKLKDELSEIDRRELNEYLSSTVNFIELESTELESTELESTELESTELESTELESTELESTELESTELESTELDFVPGFDFELYFMADGKIKKIVYQKETVLSVQELQFSYDTLEVTFPKFQLIALKALNDQYTKILSKDTLYYFNQNFKIVGKRAKFINTNGLDLYAGFEISNINITAIVGKNGTGKSTIIELLLMALNNIAKSIQTNKAPKTFGLEELFYTIHTNYSIHSLNHKYYEGEWLYKLFHKNDAYQTPIVIEPYRENGDIQINTLDDLTKQRLLATILEPSLEIDNSKITEKQSVTHFDIVVDTSKIERIIRNMRKKYHRSNTFFDPNFVDGIDEVLHYEKNQNIIRYIDTLVGYELPDIDNGINRDRWNQNGSSEHPLFNSSIQDDFLLYSKIAKVYICYKVQNIVNTYKAYELYIEDFDNEVLLNKLVDDKTHVTFKLHQAIYFLKYKTLERIGRVSVNELSNHIKNIKEQNYAIASLNSNIHQPPLLSTIEVLPPAFFKVDIFLDEKVPFDQLSSGEKQKIFAMSSVIYHLQNIESIHRGEETYVKYNYVNIILDEIELYFHPDMQRTFVYDFLDAIQNKGGFNHITGLNIIMVTHSPFVLSDILKSNILYFGDQEDIDSIKDQNNTFGANIHTLLDNSFFMKNGLMGEYAKKKIENVINKLTKYKTSKYDVSQYEKYEMKQLISNIGEPFLKQKLFDMYFSVFPDKNHELSILEKEKKLLESKIKRLKG